MENKMVEREIEEKINNTTRKMGSNIWLLLSIESTVAINSTSRGRGDFLFCCTVTFTGRRAELETGRFFFAEHHH